MATTNLNPAAGASLNPAQSFSCVITAVGATEVTLSVEDGSSSYSIWTLSGGFQAGYTGNAATLSGVTTLSNVSRTAGWWASPLIFTVTETIAGLSTEQSWTYNVSGIAVYPEGIRPYNESIESDGIVEFLNDIGDVAAANPADGEVLGWDDGAGAWTPRENQGGGGGVTDHGALTGLADDDHTQYHTDARGDARYYTQTQVDTAIGNPVHVDEAAEISGIVEKLTPAADDILILEDSDDSFNKKKAKLSNLPRASAPPGAREVVGYLGQWARDDVTPSPGEWFPDSETIASTTSIDIYYSRIWGNAQALLDTLLAGDVLRIGSDIGANGGLFTISSVNFFSNIYTITGTCVALDGSATTWSPTGTYYDFNVVYQTGDAEVNGVFGYGTWDYQNITSPTVPDTVAAGEFRFNNANPTSATQVYISKTNKQGVNVGVPLGEVEDWRLTFWDADGTEGVVALAGAPSDQSTYWTIPISSIVGDSTLTDTATFGVSIAASDQVGLPTSIVTPTVDQALLYDDGLGKWVNQNLITTFLGLTDTPSSFSGEALKYVRVNATQDELEFTASAGGVTDHGALTGLSDDDHPQYQTKVMERIAGSTYSTVQHMQDIFHSSGLSSGGVIADAGSGQITVTAGTGFIRATDDALDALLYFDFPNLTATAITDQTVRYVGVEYNAGTPQVVVRTTDAWDNNTEFRLGTVARDGTTLHISQAPHQVGDHAGIMIERGRETMPLARDNRTGGLALGETGTRNVTVTAGGLWEGLSRYSISAIDTSGVDTMTRFYRDGGSGWTYQTAQTQWNNTQYDNGTGTLANITVARYVAHYFYVAVDGELYMQYGQNQYTSLVLAQEDPVPSVPFWFKDHCKFVGRIIFQQNAASASVIESSFDTSLTGSPVTDHGVLAGLGDDDHTQYLLADGTRTLSGNLTITGTVDGRDVSTDGTKLDGIEASADVTDTANVTTAGALMDSEVNNLSGIKTLTVPDNTVITTAAQNAGDVPALSATGTLQITDGVNTTTYYSDGVRSQGAAVGVVAADGPPGSANYSGLYSDSVEVRNTTNQTAGLYVGDVSNIPSMDLVGATYTRTDTVGGIATNSPTFSIKGRDIVADRVIVDANQTHATGNGSDHADVASNTAVRLTADQHAAVTGADTPSASNVFLTEGDVGVAELSALMTDGPIAAFRIFADDTALQAAQGVANQYGWRQSDTTLWRDSGPAGAWEQVGASGTETNDLEAACAGIAANEIVIGASPGIASYTPIASLTDEPSPTTGDKLLIQTTEGLRSLDVSNLPAGSETNNLESVCTGIALNDVPVGSGAGVATYTATTGTGSVVRAGSPTLTTPDIGTPTIASFASATHDHTNAAGGGQLGTNALADDAVTLAKIDAHTGAVAGVLGYGASGNPAEVSSGAAGTVLTSTGTTTAPTFQAVAKPTPMKVFIESPTSGDVIILGRCDRAYTIASVYGVIDSGTSVVVSVASGASRATADQTNVNAQTVSSTTTGNSLTVANTGFDTADWVWVTIGTVTGTVDGLNLTIAFS